MQNVKKIAVLAVIVLAGLARQAAAQDDYWHNYLQKRKSPIMQEVAKNNGKFMIRSQWNGQGGNGIILQLLRDPVFRNELGISDQQYERIQETAKDTRDPEKNPELKKIYEEIQSIEDTHGPTLQDADEQTKKRFLELQEKVTAMTVHTGRDRLTPYNVADALGRTLTPEQKRKIKEVQLVASLSEKSIFPPSMFEALDLTDAQKQEMAEIKKKLESEFEQPLDDLANRQRMVDNKLHDEMEKQGYNGISFEKLDEATRKQIEQDLTGISQETQSHGERLATQFKIKMFDVLTDEQWARLQNLTDNPTGLAKTMQKIMAGWREKKGEWRPGPDSWKPGDPIPEEYRQQREERRFPRRQ